MAQRRNAYINGYFRSQRITGQQRYATEIANRLVAADTAFRELGPTSTTRFKGLTWFELQTVLPVIAGRGVLLSLTARAPAVHPRHAVTIHDLFPLTNPEWYSPAYVRVHSALLKHQLRHAAAFVTVSEPVREEVLTWTGGRAPIVLAPNAVDRVQFAGPRNEPPDLTLAGGRAGYFLAVGSIDPRKNYPTLIAAHTALPPAVRAEHPLLIVGASAATFAATTVAGDEHIRRPGYVTDAQLVDLYANAAAFISVSFGEGFGIPIVEAQAQGAPLILSDIATHRWVAGGAATYVDPHSVEDVRAALLAAVDSSRRPDSAKPVDGRFDWDASAETIRTLVSSIA